MVTLKEIARECNVSATTVSNILNGKPKVSEATRQKVMQVVKKRGYQPNYVAQGLRNQRTRTIAVIAEDIGQFTTPGIIESVMARFESEGYHTILWNLRLYARWSASWYNNEQAYRSILNPVLQELRSIKVEGVIYVAGHARLIHCTTQDYEVPMIMAYAYPDLPGIPSVTIDPVRHVGQGHLLADGLCEGRGGVQLPVGEYVHAARRPWLEHADRVRYREVSGYC